MSKGKKWMLFGIITGSVLITLVVVGFCIGLGSFFGRKFESITSKRLSDYYETTEYWECDEYDLILSYDSEENGFAYNIAKTTFTDEEPFSFTEYAWYKLVLHTITKGESESYICGRYTINKDKLKLKIKLLEYFNISEDTVLIFVPIYKTTE